MGIWIECQSRSYKKGKRNKEIDDWWEQFINSKEYCQYFRSNEEIWKMKFSDIKAYINKHKKIPPENDKNKEIAILGVWISTQHRIYKRKDRIMKNEDIYDIWTDFINNSPYDIYFMSNIQKWKVLLEKVKKYIDKYHKNPTACDKCKDTRVLGSWIRCQKISYKKKIRIMKNNEIYSLWIEFVTNEKYAKYYN